MSKYSLAISETTIVSVVAVLKNEAGRPNQYKFDLVCLRKGADELKELMESGANLKDVMRDVTTNWRGQRLVLDEDGKPADFSLEAFDALLDIGGMPTLLFNRYYTESSATAKN